MFPQSSRTLVGFMEAMAEYGTVVAFDLPGYGESDQPDSRIRAAEYADTVWQVVDQLDLLGSVGQIDLFGIHAGSKLAVAAMKQRPGAVRKLVLSSAAVLESEQVDQLKAELVPAPLDRNGTRFSRNWQMLVEARGTSDYETLAEVFAEIVRHGTGSEWGHLSVFEYNREFIADVAQIRQPIALINPGDGLYEMTPRTLEYLVDGVLIDRPDWGLNYLQTNSREAADVVSDFLYGDAGESPGTTRNEH